MKELTHNNNSYYISGKKIFKVDVQLKDPYILKCYNFAYDMTFRGIGKHRSCRSGGQNSRKNGEIFINTFQGKIAECGVYQYFKNKGFSITEPDFTEMNLGKWDSCDFIINNKRIAVKSTKKYGNLLLLETKDWDKYGRYIPNINTDNNFYNYFILTRINIDGTSIMKNNNILYSNTLPNSINLKNIILNKNWGINLVGYIDHNEFVNDVIKKEHILPQNSLLNNRQKMDAENYYVQAGDMHDLEDLCACL